MSDGFKMWTTSYWWVPIIVLLLSGIGFLIREGIQERRTPGAILTYSDDPIPVAVRVELDTTKAIETTTGWARFESVPPGKHQLAYFAEGYETVVVRPVEVRGGSEREVIFPELKPVSRPFSREESPSTQPPGAKITTWRRVPQGSSFRLIVSSDSPESPLTQARASVSFEDGRELEWLDRDLRSGVSLTLDNQIAVRLLVLSLADSAVSIEARIVAPDGSLFGTPYSAAVKGHQGQATNWAFFIAVARE